jgi:FtsH-binding integral membrane protein
MDSLRSYSTNLIDNKDEVQKLYLGIGLATTLGGMASSAMWSGTLSAALGKGWFLERAPFWGVLIALLAVAFFITRLGKYAGGVFMA